LNGGTSKKTIKANSLRATTCISSNLLERKPRRSAKYQGKKNREGQLYADPLKEKEKKKFKISFYKENYTIITIKIIT